MKIYLEAKPEPWITWDKDLWKESQSLINNYGDFEITSMQANADIIMAEYYPGCDIPIRLVHATKPHIIYVESLEGDEIDDFIIKMRGEVMVGGKDVVIATDSVELCDTLKDRTIIPVVRWNRPTRVPNKMIWDEQSFNRSGGFTIVSAGDRLEDNMSEIMKTYFAICLHGEGDDNEGEMLKLMHDVDIFSAQDIPFEVFNNVYFHGLQPNPKMFKKIKNSRLFISPYNGPGVPINAIDAITLGVPVIVRDTISNRAVFNWNDKCFFSDERELAQKIKFFSDISTDDPEYQRIVTDGFEAVREAYSVSNSLKSLIYIIEAWKGA